MGITLGSENNVQVAGTRAAINVQTGKLSEIVHHRVKLIDRARVNVNRLSDRVGPSICALCFSFCSFPFNCSLV